MISTIKNHLASFPSYPPHTAQRLAELILTPNRHYKALASYLHAVDRVVQVTSGTDVFPLPPAVPNIQSTDVNGDSDSEERDPVSWAQGFREVGSDEALGGALLTMIPWLTRSPEGGVDNALALGPATNTGAKMNSESTETIDGPNGVGSVETVSVSVNGVPSTGPITGVTQGELLRQEQKAGVVPVSQLHRPLESSPSVGSSHLASHLAHSGAAGQEGEEAEGREADGEDEEDEIPHARGPEEIGMSDTGPQSKTMSFVGDDGGIDMQGLNVEAAVGRKVEDDGRVVKEEDEVKMDEDDNEEKQATDVVKKEGKEEAGTEGEEGGEVAGVKREAEQPLEQDDAKKVKEEEGQDVKVKDDEEKSGDGDEKMELT